MGSIHEVAEGIQTQGADESIGYKITTTVWGSTPTSVSAKAYDESSADRDVTATVFPTNTPSVAGDVITLDALVSLTAHHTYRIEVKFTSGGNIYECYFRVHCDF